MYDKNHILRLHFIKFYDIIIRVTLKVGDSLMAGAIRSCAGGVVFCGDQVFILMTDKGEWVMPKGVIRNHNRSNDVALWRVEDEAGIRAEIIGIAGNTRYDFFSESRGKEISNRIQWFAMRADDNVYHISYEQGFLNGGYYPISVAREKLTYEVDKEILDTAYDIYLNSNQMRA